MKTRRLWLIVIVLAVLTPLGLWLPSRLGAGEAWGEWSAEQLAKQVGFVPRGMARSTEQWRAPVPDYAQAGRDDRPFAHQNAAYILSAVVGLVVVAGIMWALGRFLSRRDKADAP